MTYIPGPEWYPKIFSRPKKDDENLKEVETIRAETPFSKIEKEDTRVKLFSGEYGVL
jgi:hypothetical protein